MIARRLIPILILSVVVSGTTLAASHVPSPTPTPPVVSAADQPAHVNQLRTIGTAELDRRLSSLQPLLDKLKTASSAAGSDRTALISAVQAEVAAEGQLKTQLSSRTTLDTVRADIQSILYDYRTYGLLLPFAQTAVATDDLTAASKSLKTSVDQLAAKRQAISGLGGDTGALDQAITSGRIKLATAATGIAAANAGTKVIPQNGTDYTAAHTALEGLRGGLQTARTDLTAAQGYVTAGINSVTAAATAKAK